MSCCCIAQIPTKLELMASRRRSSWLLRQRKESQHPQHDDSHHNPLHELLAGGPLDRKRSAWGTCHISTTSSAPMAKIPSPEWLLAWRRRGGLITAYGLHVAARSWRDLAALGSIKHRRVILALTVLECQ